MRFFFSAGLLFVLLVTGFVLTFGRMLAVLFLPQLPRPEKPLRA